MLPKFKYQPNCFENEIFEKASDGKNVTCQCCEKKTEFYYTTMYSSKNVNCLCPDCIKSGLAAEKFEGDFIQDAETLESDEKTEELFKRTPGLVTWQGEYWLSCCDDYCAFIAYVGIEELEQMNLVDEVLSDYANQDGYSEQDVRLYLNKQGNMAGYLFQCLHCRKYRLWVDAN